MTRYSITYITTRGGRTHVTLMLDGDAAAASATVRRWFDCAEIIECEEVKYE